MTDLPYKMLTLDEVIARICAGERLTWVTMTDRDGTYGIPIAATKERRRHAMTTYRIDGFNRQNHAELVTILLDPTDPLRMDLYRRAEAIAGPEFCFHISQNLNSPIPDDCKGIVFRGDEELYARLPQLNLYRGQRRRRR
jgi:hypothetical protein